MPPKDQERVESKPWDGDSMPGEYLRRRSAAFQAALCRKGLPMVWGTGKLREDPVFKAWQAQQRGEPPPEAPEAPEAPDEQRPRRRRGAARNTRD